MEKFVAGVVGMLVLVMVWFVGTSGSSNEPSAVAGTNAPSTIGAVPVGAPTTAAGHVHSATATDHLKSLFPNGDDKGFSSLENGHQHDHSADVYITDAAVRNKLRHQLDLTMTVARKYPTVKDAVAAGYRRAGPFSPGLGAHYTLQNGQGLNVDGVMDDADILTPLSIIYDGTDPTSPIAGFMYYSFAKNEPAGFAGPNDHWHYHTNVCLKKAADGGIDAPFGADSDSTAKLCASAGGYLYKQTQWMLHVWTIPAYTDPLGVFAHNSPALPCRRDGSYYTLPVTQWPSHPLDVCKNQ